MTNPANNSCSRTSNRHLLSVAKHFAFMARSKIEVAGSSRISITGAPLKVSLISLGWSSANELIDLPYSAAVIRSADSKPFSEKSHHFDCGTCWRNVVK